MSSLAASVERARALIALWRGQAEPDATLKTIGPASAREFFVEAGALLTLIGLTVLALGLLGVPWPWSTSRSGVYWTVYFAFFIFVRRPPAPADQPLRSRCAPVRPVRCRDAHRRGGVPDRRVVASRIGMRQRPRSSSFSAASVCRSPAADAWRIEQCGRLPLFPLAGIRRTAHGLAPAKSWRGMTALFATLVFGREQSTRGGDTFWIMSYCCFGWLGIRRSARYMRDVATPPPS